MAKIIRADVESQLISSGFSVWKTVIIGVILGLGFLLFTTLIKTYIIDLASTSGNIATILVAILSIGIMIRFRLAHPLIISVATGVTLWGLMQWMSGLSVVEMMVWSGLIYALAYTLFSWIMRYSRVLPSIAIIMIVIIVERLVTQF